MTIKLNNKPDKLSLVLRYCFNFILLFYKYHQILQLGHFVYGDRVHIQEQHYTGTQETKSRIRLFNCSCVVYSAWFINREFKSVSYINDS